jgi:hypothetical protein
MNPLHIVVRFAEGIPLDAQGPVLLAMERSLRESTGLDCRVYKDLKGDDSKLRVMMTVEQRAKL